MQILHHIHLAVAVQIVLYEQGQIFLKFLCISSLFQVSTPLGYYFSIGHSSFHFLSATVFTVTILQPT